MRKMAIFDRLEIINSASKLCKLETTTSLKVTWLPKFPTKNFADNVQRSQIGGHVLLAVT